MVNGRSYGPGMVDVPASLAGYLAAAERRAGNPEARRPERRGNPGQGNPREIPNHRREGRKGADGLTLNVRGAAFVAGVEADRRREKVAPAVGFDTSVLRSGDEVILIRRYGMGDALMATPLIRHLSNRGVIVDLLTHERFAPLFEGSPYLRRVLTQKAENIGRDYDACLDVDLYSPSPQSTQQNRIREMGAYLGIALESADECRLDLFLRDDELGAARALLAGLPRPWIAYAWASNGKNRNWSRPTHEKAFRDLSKSGGSIIVLGDKPAPVGYAPSLLNLSGKTPGIRDAAAIIAVCDGIVTPDTGLFHIAAALDKPIAAYFGPFPIEDRTSGAETSLTVINDAPSACPWAPCGAFDCPFVDTDLQAPCLAPGFGALRDWADTLSRAGDEGDEGDDEGGAESDADSDNLADSDGTEEPAPGLRNRRPGRRKGVAAP